MSGKVCGSRKAIGECLRSLAGKFVVFPIATILFLGLFCGSLPGAEKDVVYSTATGFYKKEKWQDAIGEYRKFLTNWPEEQRAVNARFYLGLSEINVGEYRSARDNLRKFAETEPNSKNLNHALYRIAECSYLLDELQASRREMNQFLERFPDDPYGERALPYLADVEMRLGNFDIAAGLFRKSLERFPNGELADDSRFGLARSLEGMEKYEEAEKAYEQLADNPMGSRAAEALLNLGTRRYEDGKYAAAEQAFSRLERDFPQSRLLSLARLNRGFSLYRLERYEDAVVQFEAVSSDETQRVTAGFWKGMAEKNQGRIPEAIDTFSKTAETDPDDPLVESLIYQRGECEKRRRNYPAALKEFQEVIKRFPEGELADDALHLSAVCALEQQDLKLAQELIAKFTGEFPQSKLLWSQELLRGRLFLLEKNPEAARTQFRRVLVESNSELTKGWSRYYIAYSFYTDKDYKQALQMSEPLAENLEKLPKERRHDLAGIYLLQGACLLELAKANGDRTERLRQLEQAESNASKYLEMLPSGEQAQRAWGLLALAAAHRGDAQRLLATLETLKEKMPAEGTDREEIGRTLHEIAEVAFTNKNFAISTELFRKLTELKPTEDLYLKGLHGLGWSEYNSGRFADAAIQFQELIEASPEHELSADSAFMLAKSRQEEKKTEEAIGSYDRVLQKYSTSKFAFPAALQKSRLLDEIDKKDEANLAYSAAYEQFPSEADRDKLLDEWAIMNYRRQDFAEADRLFSRLAQEFPDSPLADNARLSLAESELVAINLDNADAEAFKKLDKVRDDFLKLTEDRNADADVKQTAYSQLLKIGVAKKDWNGVSNIASKIESDFPHSKYLDTALYRRGEAALNLNEFEAAEQSMKRLLSDKEPVELEKQTWYRQVPVLLAESLLQQKKYDELKTVTDQWRAKMPDSETQAALDEIEGRGLVNQAKFEEARSAFERVLANPKAELSEVAARSQFMIAESYLAQQQYAAAEKEYIKVESLYKIPEWQARAAFQQGACLEALKDTNKAIAQYESLLKNWPESDQADKARIRLETLKKLVDSTKGK